MRRNALGRTGLSVPLVGVGTSGFGIQYKSNQSVNSEAVVQESLSWSELL